MKKNRFIRFPALLLVLFGALVFGCSDGGDDGDSPDLPADLKEELKSLGFENLPLPSGGVYDQWICDVEDHNEMKILWRDTTEDIFGAYVAELKEVFGKEGSAVAGNEDEQLRWRWTSGFSGTGEVDIVYVKTKFTSDDRIYLEGILILRLRRVE
jgi:hypothetical protein